MVLNFWFHFLKLSLCFAFNQDIYRLGHSKLSFGIAELPKSFIKIRFFVSFHSFIHSSFKYLKMRKDRKLVFWQRNKHTLVFWKICTFDDFKYFYFKAWRRYLPELEHFATFCKLTFFRRRNKILISFDEKDKVLSYFFNELTWESFP